MIPPSAPLTSKSCELGEEKFPIILEFQQFAGTPPAACNSLYEASSMPKVEPPAVHACMLQLYIMVVIRAKAMHNSRENELDGSWRSMHTMHTDQIRGIMHTSHLLLSFVVEN